MLAAAAAALLLVAASQRTPASASESQPWPPCQDAAAVALVAVERLRRMKASLARLAVHAELGTNADHPTLQCTSDREIAHSGCIASARALEWCPQLGLYPLLEWLQTLAAGCSTALPCNV